MMALSVLSIGAKVLEVLRQEEQFVKCLHAVGVNETTPGWRCDPQRTIILHKPDQDEIVSYGKFRISFCSPFKNL